MLTDTSSLTARRTCSAKFRIPTWFASKSARILQLLRAKELPMARPGLPLKLSLIIACAFCAAPSGPVAFDEPEEEREPSGGSTGGERLLAQAAGTSTEVVVPPSSTSPVTA